MGFRGATGGNGEGWGPLALVLHEAILARPTLAENRTMVRGVGRSRRR